MNLQQIFSRFEPAGAGRVPVGLVGAGEFGATFVAQAGRIKSLEVIAICDRDTRRAHAAALAAGHEPEKLRICTDLATAQAAVASGAVAIVASAQELVQLPL